MGTSIIKEKEIGNGCTINIVKIQKVFASFIVAVTDAVVCIE